MTTPEEYPTAESQGFANHSFDAHPRGGSSAPRENETG